jgi:hypothetical protein
MENNNTMATFPLLLTGLILILALGSCKRNLPLDRDSIGTEMRFTKTVYDPILGRNTVFTNNFAAGNSSLPLDFKIINMRTRDGSPAPEVTAPFPVKIWTQPYLGNEKSLSEIEAKRKIENRSIFEIREHSGQFIMWSTLHSDIKTQPDSGYVFDVEVSNTGGRRYFRDLKLMPLKPRSYEPSRLDPITGLATSVGIGPSRINNIRGAKTNDFVFDVNVQFNKTGDGNSLKFRFVDSLYHTIDPNLFNTTKWETLVHGFDMVKTSEYVKYQVAYPIPLIQYQTSFTNQTGDRARAAFSFERIGYGNTRELASLGLDFAIYEPGDWEIIFWFRRESPKFTND